MTAPALVNPEPLYAIIEFLLADNQRLREERASVEAEALDYLNNHLAVDERLLVPG